MQLKNVHSYVFTIFDKENAQNIIEHLDQDFGTNYQDSSWLGENRNIWKIENVNDFATRAEFMVTVKI